MGLIEPQKRSKGKGSHYVTGPRAAGLPWDPSALIQEMLELRSVGSYAKAIFLVGGGVALGLCCCPQAFSSCGVQRLLSIAVRGLLIAMVSLVAEHGL